MADLTLTARRRTTLGKAVKRLRLAGVTPANIYGHKLESLAIEVDSHELASLIRRAGRTSLIQITIDGEAGRRPVLVREFKRRAVNDQLLHVDFFQVSMREKLTVEVPVTLTGVAPAVEAFDGIVVQSLESLSVHCLPGDIPSNIEVDVSPLVDLSTTIFVRDIVAPAGVEILNDADLPVVSVSGTVVEEEPEAEGAEAAAEESGAAAEDESAAATDESE